MIAIGDQTVAPLEIGGVTLDHYAYDEAADVLYLTVGPPRLADDDDDSLEGDVIFFDGASRVIGVTMIGPREMLERDGALHITLPSRGLAVRWERAVVEPLLVETLRYA